MQTQTKPNVTFFDPTGLASLAAAQYSNNPQLASALKRCTCCRWDGPGYLYFIYPANSAQLSFKQSAMLYNTVYGTLVIDIAHNDTIIGIELLDRVMDEGFGEEFFG